MYGQSLKVLEAREFDLTVVAAAEEFRATQLQIELARIGGDALGIPAVISLLARLYVEGR